MKWLPIIFAAAFVSGCGACNQVKESADRPAQVQQYSNNAKGIHSLITKQAKSSFKKKYKKATKHKAFAQSVSGAWSWKSSRTSVEHAKTSALVGCQKNNKDNEKAYPCELINVNGKWTEAYKPKAVQQ
jgi:hypothetical protein